MAVMIGQTTSDAGSTDRVETSATADSEVTPEQAGTPAKPAAAPESGGRDGPDPTRFGDWEKNGRCIDF